MPSQIRTQVLFAVGAMVAGLSARAGDITSNSIVAIPQHVTGSGNGTLDLRMFTYSGSEIANVSGSFNGDNGNNNLPHGSGSDNLNFAESYVTTAGDLKAYYNLNFATGTISQIVLFLDLNETGGGIPTNTLSKLDIVLNPTSIQGNPSAAGDVSSATQAGIQQVFSGGTLLANLNPQPAGNLPVNSQGAGFADYAIATGINPFALTDADVLLFNISMSELNNGSEEIFLSGTYAPADVGIVPEPTSAALLVAGCLGLWRRRVKARSSRDRRALTVAAY